MRGYFYTFILMLFLAAGLLVQSNQARACGFTPAGDWVCAQESGGATGGGTVTKKPSVESPFKPGSPIIMPTENNSDLKEKLSVLDDLFGQLDVCMQSSLVNIISSVDDLNSIGPTDLIAFVVSMLNVQSMAQSTPQVFVCPDGSVTLNFAKTKLCSTVSGFNLQEVISSFFNPIGDNPWTEQSMRTSSCGSSDVTTGGSPGGGGTGGGGSTGGGGGGGGHGAGCGKDLGLFDGSCEPVDSVRFDEELKKLVVCEEGFRNCAYKDSVGKWTIGIGHLIVPGDGYGPGTCLSDAQVWAQYERDVPRYKSAAAAQMSQLGENSHEFLLALVSVNYQLGTAWNTKKFPTGWGIMKQGRYSDAAAKFESYTCYGCWNASVANGGTPKRVAAFASALRNLEACGRGGGGGVLPPR